MDEDSEYRICEKRRYNSEDEANRQIEFINSYEPDLKLRAYKCHTCHNWHLTSKVKRSR